MAAHPPALSATQFAELAPGHLRAGEGEGRRQDLLRRQHGQLANHAVRLQQDDRRPVGDGRDARRPDGREAHRGQLPVRAGGKPAAHEHARPERQPVEPAARRKAQQRLLVRVGAAGEALGGQPAEPRSPAARAEERPVAGREEARAVVVEGGARPAPRRRDTATRPPARPRRGWKRQAAFGPHRAENDRLAVEADRVWLELGGLERAEPLLLAEAALAQVRPVHQHARDLSVVVVEERQGVGEVAAGRDVQPDRRRAEVTLGAGVDRADRRVAAPHVEPAGLPAAAAVGERLDREQQAVPDPSVDGEVVGHARAQVDELARPAHAGAAGPPGRDLLAVDRLEDAHAVLLVEGVPGLTRDGGGGHERGDDEHQTVTTAPPRRGSPAPRRSRVTAWQPPKKTLRSRKASTSWPAARSASLSTPGSE